MYIRRPLATARGARERRYECSGCGGFEHGLLCGGARSGPGDGAPDKCVFLRDPRATLDIGACPSNPSIPSNPSNPSKLARRGLLEAAPKCFLTGSESDVRHQGLPVKPRKPLKSLIKMCFCFFTGSKSDVRHRGLPFKPLKSSKSLETCQKGLARGCVKMFLYGIRKRRETSGPARQTPQTPQIPHQNVCLFLYGIQKRR